MEQEIAVYCMNGFTLRVEGKNLAIDGKHGIETVPISRIQTFTLYEPHGLVHGKIIFQTAQANTIGINVGFGISAAFGSEKIFFFTKDDLNDAVRLKEYISNFEKSVENAAQQELAKDRKVVSVTDEIRGLKGLLDEGIITPEEFDAKKKQLLGI